MGASADPRVDAVEQHGEQADPGEAPAGLVGESEVFFSSLPPREKVAATDPAAQIKKAKKPTRLALKKVS